MEKIPQDFINDFDYEIVFGSATFQIISFAVLIGVLIVAIAHIFGIYIDLDIQDNRLRTFSIS
jgi:hypothetical protein